MNIFKQKPVLQRLATIIQESDYRTKKEFCEAMGIHPQTLPHILNPKYTDQGISKLLMLGLAKHDYNLKWLFWGIGEKKN